MYIRRMKTQSSVKVRMDGHDKHGKTTCRSIVVNDCLIEEVEAIIRKALEDAIRGEAKEHK